MSIPPERVLLVDDDRNLLVSFKRQFHNQLNLITAASGEDGIQAIARRTVRGCYLRHADAQHGRRRVPYTSPFDLPEYGQNHADRNANLGVATQAINNAEMFFAC